MDFKYFPAQLLSHMRQLKTTEVVTYKATRLEEQGQYFVTPGSRVFLPHQAGFSVLQSGATPDIFNL